MSTHGANIKDKKYLMPSARNTNNKQCLICKKNIKRKKKQLVCSSCSNDCRNGMWNTIGKTIDKRIKKEIFFKLFYRQVDTETVSHGEGSNAMQPKKESPRQSEVHQIKTSPADKVICSNCKEQEVLYGGDWCDDCNLPERSVFT